MAIALFVIGSMIFLGTLLDTSLEAIKDKVDVNVYFVADAAEDDVLALKAQVEALPEVETVRHQTKEEALEEFLVRRANDTFTIQALEELGENPLGPVLSIKAKDPSQYVGIAEFLQGDNLLSDGGEEVVDTVNYFENKVAIDKLTQIVAAVEMTGLAIVIILTVIAVIITFNTIRLAIYISREEISVMRLVGASISYIRGPFIITGIIYGVVGALVTLAVFYPITYWLGSDTEAFFVGFNLFRYYTENFGYIFAVILGAGVLIGALSSYLAVMKYLKR